MNVSVIVTTLNDELHLNQLMLSLKKQIIQPFEIIHIDNIPHKTAGECLNIGAKQSKGNILLFLAADVILHNDTINEVINQFTMNPKLLSLSARPIPDESSICRLEYNMYYTLAYILSVLRIRYITSAAFIAIKRNIFESVGGFTNSYNNDGELSKKIHQMGYTSFKYNMTYTVSARRYIKMGLIRFNNHYIYTLENFIPELSRLFRRFGNRISIEHNNTGGHYEIN
jgi:glycosyltransferase involved in cell wall biosynthesis